ncbi:metal-dependent hydrolase [Candidatus Viridilinea mediisalina]|uniref:UPF0173 metal-dependent hydrolase CJ255_18180 n=1 Tax=Candidatus Viridilinea mediisalina TaxID=2024553 RepID=A0A2A6RF38_9CHLR|nr:metal-dependent hydrolase [Candidatus Viridilinea mediisalina]PDW01632.1 metal-dependent hydrolase [Candidatus Viridilinea mediisalina]
MTTLGKNVTITWLGHGTFHMTTPEGKGILIDPWIEGNPSCPDALKAQACDQLAAIFVTHAHFDHVGDLVEIAQQTGAPVFCQYDLVPYFENQNITGEQLVGFNKGGTVSVADLRATMTNAVHSSTTFEEGSIIGLGTAAGFVFRFSNDFTIYFTGDTCVTMDMQIIADLYKPDLTILPIGDHFTMDPRQAGYAMKLIRSPYVIPCHFGTFEILTGTPEQLVEACKEFGVETQVIALKPGESVS